MPEFKYEINSIGFGREKKKRHGTEEDRIQK